MQLRKIITAGTLATLMAGSSIAFAATLADLPQPFITSAGADDFLVVVGSKSTDATGLASDIVGAINIAARLGGETGASKTVGATTAGVSISGEGKQLATSTTKVFLNNTMGKSGLRNTLTKDDLPTTLKNGVLSDADAATTHNYQQFIYLTPSAASNPNYELEFKKPGSSSSVDPTYNFGRFPTSPTDNDYLYRTYVTFDKLVNGVTAVGEKLELFGKTFTIHSDTTFGASSVTGNKLVLAGGSETVVMKGGETRTVTIGGKTYDVTLDGVTSTPKASVTVKTGGTTDSKDISQGSTTTVNGLSIFVDTATQLSTTDQTTNKAKLMLGAEKLVLQTGSKVKVGDSEDSIDGTYVNLTVSSGNLSAVQVAVGGRSSNEDFLKAGGTYKDPTWKTFSLSFPSVSPDLTASTRDVIKVSPSGDNLLQVQFTDANSNTKTINWGYKSASTGTAFSLADNSGNRIRVQENESVAKDEYFVVDAGDFTHLYKFTSDSVSSTPATSDYIEITDQFTGVTRKITVGIDSADPTVIDGQTYQFTANTTALRANWGVSAANNTVGTYQTIWPKLKGKNGEYLALYQPSTNFVISNGTQLQLPTGAITFTLFNNSATAYQLNITSVNNEDGSASALATSPTTINLISASSGTLNLGKTATGGLQYNLSAVTSALTTASSGITVNLTVSQISAAQQFQPGLILVEEKDDSSNAYSAVVGATTEASGSNNVAIPTAPTFTFSAATSGTGPGGVALGSDSTMTDYVDLYGLYARRTTTGQDTLTLYYPDDQVTANLAVVGVDGSATVTAGGSGTSVRESVPIKTAVARLDADVSAADRSNKNLILVGGPAVNSLVAELAAANKTKDVAWYRAQGAGTALLDLVEPGFGTGKVALVVAGYAAADTRAVASKVQDFGSQKDAFAGKKRVVWKNDVISTTAV
ncbi:MAG: S-layer protein [Candidatus Aenigmarchaeota archaeon]|nr:S-layer protein [Candidatus Aenigmarchaeota archaeon]